MNKKNSLEQFTRKFGTLISSGVPLIKSLQIIIEECEDNILSNVLETVSELIKSGRSFSNSLSEFPKIFPVSYVEIISAGEREGKLDEVMLKLSTSLSEGIIDNKLVKVEDENNEIYSIKDSIIKKVNNIILNAVEQEVSDIYILPGKLPVVKFRIDGKFKEYCKLTPEIYNSIISRMKIMANLELSETMLPQNGRIMMKIKEKKIDMRVSSFPSVIGETIFLKMIYNENLKIKPEDIIENVEDLEKFSEITELSHGIVIFAGPSGSGKTTTMLSALNLIKEEKNSAIVTVEEPVEYTFDGIVQVQVRKEIGLTQSVILRSILRSDPDVIMVTEFEEKEILLLMSKAALTGHLILTQMDSLDSFDTINKMINMEIPPFVITSSLKFIVNQRLLRKVCPKCSEEKKIKKNLLKKWGLDDKSLIFFEGKGCEYCNQTGFRGRFAIQEIYKISKDVQEAIILKDLKLIKSLLDEEIKNRLRSRAVEAVIAGKTTFEEIERIL